MTSPVVWAQFSLEYYSSLVSGRLQHFREVDTSLNEYRVAHSQAWSADRFKRGGVSHAAGSSSDIWQPSSSCLRAQERGRTTINRAQRRRWGGGGGLSRLFCSPWLQHGRMSWEELLIEKSADNEKRGFIITTHSLQHTLNKSTWWKVILFPVLSPTSS